MIPFDLRYVRAESAEEAVAAWSTANKRGETAHYLGGGTEIVTLARESKLYTDEVIDCSRIPEASAVETVTEGGREWFAYGAALPLNRIVDGDHQGLLRACLAGIADRTTRNSITLGGNICGMLPYREAVLPWLLAEGLVETAAPRSTGGTDEGAPIRRVRRPIAELFDKRLKPAPGELVLRFLLPMDWAPSDVSTPPAAPPSPGADGRRSDPTYGPRTAAGPGWFYQRRTKDPRVDYPLVTLAMAEIGDELRVALGGVWGYPARATVLEEAIREAGGAAAFLDRAGTAPGANAGNAGHGTAPGANAGNAGHGTAPGANAGNAGHGTAPGANAGNVGHGTAPGAGTGGAGARRIGAALDAEGRSFREDHRGSAAYRRELAIQAIAEGLAHLATENGAMR